LLHAGLADHPNNVEPPRNVEPLPRQTKETCAIEKHQNDATIA